ncbi:hypothetical protein I4I73_18225 [Pseudonocardia sp. KRD-184]|uniref:Uncharacterized protein n=1 Tax=Pseudonocardia oceani TaxID=2792013 RepID=A0ABS6U9D6_9PSEU|nr:DUF6474 family protein [Pseudonocardia oceani]MBW0093818.1 hypothetical protein [Pseudonocardia oceani]MBW0097919.1 hypothetical protein [Pseudonocardia oceani]MBW0110508.1 hypothetical protein [Pseudonocardia oceani]MBW0124470.1 hypothetical protein [Pseudonocardia oceani]MBW0128857.1 hypothetical protein [Pseudonocardia oceani]
MALGRRSRRTDATTSVADAAKDVGKAVKKPLTGKQAKRMIGVGTAVVPLLTPYALAVAGAARGAWDARRAARLGVAADQLGAYSGPGGALHARLSRIAEALTELEGSDTRATDDARAFVTATRPRLTDLAVAVRAAEQMPTPRRRTAYRAIGHELDRIEIDLLTHLGVVTT